MFFECIDSILRTGRLEPTHTGEQESKGMLVESYKKYENPHLPSLN